jgi:hypothetical protein
MAQYMDWVAVSRRDFDLLSATMFLDVILECLRCLNLGFPRGG